VACVLALIWVCVLREPLEIGSSDDVRGTVSSGSFHELPSRFWLYAAIVFLYGIVEALNGNWAALYLTTQRGVSAQGNRKAIRPMRRSFVHKSRPHKAFALALHRRSEKHREWFLGIRTFGGGMSHDRAGTSPNCRLGIPGRERHAKKPTSELSSKVEYSLAQVLHFTAG